MEIAHLFCNWSIWMHRWWYICHAFFRYVHLNVTTFIVTMIYWYTTLLLYWCLWLIGVQHSAQTIVPITFWPMARAHIHPIDHDVVTNCGPTFTATHGAYHVWPMARALFTISKYHNRQDGKLIITQRPWSPCVQHYHDLPKWNLSPTNIDDRHHWGDRHRPPKIPAEVEFGNSPRHDITPLQLALSLSKYSRYTLLTESLKYTVTRSL